MRTLLLASVRYPDQSGFRTHIRSFVTLVAGQRYTVADVPVTASGNEAQHILI